MNIVMKNDRPAAILPWGEALGIQKDGYYTFLGVKYAEAARFMPPETSAWERGEAPSVLDCGSYRHKAMQVYDRVTPWSGPQDPAEFSEDCLNLNIYVPADTVASGKSLPVLFMIHGGSFQDGSNRSADIMPTLRDHEFIYVAINYRLGILGYAYLKGLLGEKYAASGNLGTLDQMAALRFVHQNIAAFGGDPERITVIGASAGGKAIGTLMLLPEFDRLASQVIVSSGATQAVRSVETADKMTRNFLACMKEVTGSDDPKALLTIDAHALMQVQKKFIDNPGSTCMFGPVADDVTIPVDYQQSAVSGTAFTGRAMVGSSLHELIFHQLAGKDLTVEGPIIAHWLFGTNEVLCEQDYAQFLTENPDADQNAKNEFWTKILSDYMYRTYTERLAARLAKKGNRVWQYETCLYPALHVFDQMLAFNDVSHFPFFRGEEAIQAAKVLGLKIYTSFITFVKNQDPNVGEEGLFPTWPTLDPVEPKKMAWDKETKVVAVSELPTLQSFPEDVYRL